MTIPVGLMDGYPCADFRGSSDGFTVLVKQLIALVLCELEVA